MNRRKINLTFFGLATAAYLFGCGVTRQEMLKINTGLSAIAQLVYSDNFDGDLQQWIAEQNQASKTSIINGQMDIEASGGSTVWFTKKMEAPLMITYNAVIIDEGGINDRVSDLNCFWLASDPNNPDKLFTDTNKVKGVFEVYDRLQLYYVGLGGHNNTKTRFRKYQGTGEKPILPEHDLAAQEFLLMPNQLNHIKIIVIDSLVQYYRNNQLIYNVVDNRPYKSGFFAFRGTRNHTRISDFKVYKLSKI